MKNFIQKLPHKFLSDSRPRILGNYKILQKFQPDHIIFINNNQPFQET